MKKNKTRSVEFICLVGPHGFYIVSNNDSSLNHFPASQAEGLQHGFYVWSGTLAEGRSSKWDGKFTRAELSDLARFGLLEESKTEFRAGPNLTLEQLKVNYIKYILSLFGGHRGQAANHLNVSVKTIYNLVTKPEKEESHAEPT